MPSATQQARFKLESSHPHVVCAHKGRRQSTGAQLRAHAIEDNMQSVEVSLSIDGHHHVFNYEATKLTGARKFLVGRPSDPHYSVGIETTRCGTTVLFEDQASAQKFHSRLVAGEPVAVEIAGPIAAIYHAVFPTGWPEAKKAEQRMEFSRTTSSQFRRLCRSLWGSEPLSSESRYKQFLIRRAEVGSFSVVMHSGIGEISVAGPVVRSELRSSFREGSVTITTKSCETACALASALKAKQVHLLEQNEFVLRIDETFFEAVPDFSGLTAFLQGKRIRQIAPNAFVAENDNSN